MKKTLFFAFAILFKLHAVAQCGILPPPGADLDFAIDLDNDGYATFDIGYFIEHHDRPNKESYFQVSSSGYTATFYNGNNVETPNLLYTNIQPGEFCYIDYQYSGSGPMFQPQPPCYWPVSLFEDTGIYLTTLPFDGDYDFDGILNADEDTNGNGNPMDDDDDGDGIENFRDAVTLKTNDFENINFKLFPNPVSDGTIHFTSATPIESITIFDFMGKTILQQKPDSNTLDVKPLAAGVYLFEFKSKNASVIRKVQVQ